MRRLRVWAAGLSRRVAGLSPRARLLLFAAAAAVAGAGYLGWATVRTENRFRAALAAEDRADFPAARGLLADCLRAEPTNGRFLFHAARAARRDGDYRSAGALLALAKAQNWPPEALDWERTLLRAQTGDFAAVEPQLRTAVAAAPDTPDADVIREVLVPGYIERFELTAAHQQLVSWLGRRPRDIRLRLWMFDVARRMMLPQVAIDMAREAVDIDPDSPEARRRCGEILIENHQPTEARGHFEWLLARDPADPVAAFGLARCLRELGDGPAAVAALDRLLRDHPDRPAYLAERGYVELHAGRPQSAREWLERAIALEPSNTDLLYSLALCLEQCDRPDEAKKWRERHARAEADLLELKEVTRKIADEPRSADLRYRAGLLLLRNGYEQEGLRWFRSGLRADPTHAPTRKALDEYFTEVRRSAAAR